MITVAIDTTILVWGVRKERPKDGRADLVERCVRLIEWVESDGGSIIVPSIAAAEYLIGCSPESRELQRKELFENFFVAPFDGRAAAIAADLYDRNLVAIARKGANAPRQSLKADFNVIATAIAHGASCIYAGDNHMEAFACGRIPVKTAPEMTEMAPPPEPPKTQQKAMFFTENEGGPVAE
jgi:predicted nucleic acid-binding protein